MFIETLQSIWPGWQIERDPFYKDVYGAVYKAIRCEHNVKHSAAIKIISVTPDTFSLGPLHSEAFNIDATRAYLQNIVNAFVHEIQFMVSLRGVANIACVEDYAIVEKTDEIGWDIYLRTELLTPLPVYMQDRKMTEEEVVKLGCDICTALETCNSQNIFHGDIRPESIYIDHFGCFKLGDIGITRRLESVTGCLSQKGLYSSLYMAPEIERGLPYDTTSDLYSLGLILYRLLNNNRIPFLSANSRLFDPHEYLAATRRRMDGEFLPAPCKASPNMAAIILCACSSDPRNRFISATAMKTALMSITSGAAFHNDKPLNKSVSEQSATQQPSNPSAIDTDSHSTVTLSPPVNALKLKSAVAIFIVTLLIIGSLLVLSKVLGPSTTNSDSYYTNTYNALNGNYIARNDKWIFYINDNGAIMRMKSDGSERVAILENFDCTEIFLLGKTLYFLSSRDGCIYSSDLEGNHLTEVAVDNIGWFNISGDFIYYVNGYYEFVEETWESIPHGDFYLYRINLDGTEKARITNVATSNVNITENGIVYLDIDQNTIYCADLDGSNAQILYSGNVDDYSQSFIVYDGVLYYQKIDYENDSVAGIYAIDMTSHSKNKIVTTVPGSFTFWNDRLIYVGDSNTNYAKTYICSLNGDESQVLLTDHVYLPMVVGDDLYYYGSSETGNQVEYINLKTLEKGAFEEKTFDNLICTEEYLFFINNQDDNIYRSDLDGQNILKLTNAECDSLFYHNGNLYYEGYANGYDEDHYDLSSGIFPYGLFHLDQGGLEATWIEGSVRHAALFDGDYVYYPSIWDSHIYRTSLTSIEDTAEDPPYITAFDGADYATLYLVADGWLYAGCYHDSSDFSIVRVRLDGSSTQTIIDGRATQLQLYNGQIYYLQSENSNNYYLWKVSLDGTNAKLVIEESMQQYVLSDGVVYYTDPNYRHLYRINIDGTQKKLLADVACSDFVVKNDSIYYVNNYDQGAIYLMGTDGSNPHPIIDINCTYTDSYDYQTKGVDDFTRREETPPQIDFSSTNILSFEDPQFE